MTEVTGDASRRIVGYRNPAPCAAAPMIMGATDFSSWLPIYADEARTPPVSMDEVEAVIKGLLNMADVELASEHAMWVRARALLTRIKERQ